MSVAFGTQIGPYEVISIIVAGGMGEVYCALDPQLMRRVALKCLLVSDGDRGRKILHEARAAASPSGSRSFRASFPVQRSVTRCASLGAKPTTGPAHRAQDRPSITVSFPEEGGCCERTLPL